MSNAVPPPPPPGVPPPPPPTPPGVAPPSPTPPSVPPPPSYGQGAPVTPYGAYAVPPPPEHAGFWIRLGGYVLDWLLYGLLLLPFVIAGFAMIAAGVDDCVRVGDELVCRGRADEGVILGGIAVLFVGVVLVAVVYLRALARSGMTWGRRIVGIEVVRTDTGRPPGWGKAIGRSLFAYFISAWFIYLGYLWMIWDHDKQTWHDKVAGTYVVRR